jgi:hypothetical protein
MQIWMLLNPPKSKEDDVPHRDVHQADQKARVVSAEEVAASSKA